MTSSKCYQFKNASTAPKAVYELNIASLILAIAAAVVLPLAFFLCSSENKGTKNFGCALVVLVWLHIAAICVLTGFVESKTESVACTSSTAGSGNGTGQNTSMRMRSGYAVPPPAF
jgi:hypothetical protein